MSWYHKGEEGTRCDTGDTEITGSRGDGIGGADDIGRCGDGIGGAEDIGRCGDGIGGAEDIGWLVLFTDVIIGLIAFF